MRITTITATRVTPIVVASLGWGNFPLVNANPASIAAEIAANKKWNKIASEFGFYVIEDKNSALRRDFSAEQYKSFLQ
jgi:hypothetical protein